MEGPYNSGGVPTGTTSIFGSHSPTNCPTSWCRRGTRRRCERRSTYSRRRSAATYWRAGWASASARPTVAVLPTAFVAQTWCSAPFGAAAVPPSCCGRGIGCSFADRGAMSSRFALTLAWSWYEDSRRRSSSSVRAHCITCGCRRRNRAGARPTRRATRTGITGRRFGGVGGIDRGTQCADVVRHHRAVRAPAISTSVGGVQRPLATGEHCDVRMIDLAPSATGRVSCSTS